MALSFIPNQPILFTSDDQPCKNSDPKQYAQLLQQDDTLCVQLRNNPCDPQLFDCADDNLVVNGDFVDGSSWTAGAGWTIAGGKATHTAGSTNLLFQTIGGAMVIVQYYKVTYTISGRTAGTAYVRLGDGVGSTQGTVRSTNDTFVETLYFNDAEQRIQFECSSDFDGSIEDVVMWNLTTPCLRCSETAIDIIQNGSFASGANWTTTSGWTIATGVASHAGAGTTTLYQLLPALFIGNTYTVVFTISGYVSGTVRCQLGDGAGATQGTIRSANGTYTEDLQFFDTDEIFQFVPATTFVGNIDNVAVYDQNGQCIAEGDWVLGSTGYTHTIGNTLTIQTNSVPLVIANSTYQVKVTITGMTAGTLQLGWRWDTDNSNNLFGTDISGNGTYTFYTTPAQDSELTFMPSSDFDGTIITSSIEVTEMNYAHTIKLLDQDGNVASETINDSTDNPITYTDDYLTWCADWSTIESFDVPGTMIDSGCYYIRVLDACASVNYDSTTLVSYLKTGTHDCTVMVEAECNDYGLGFNFTGDFKLYQRLAILRISPKYPTEQDTYLYSTGRHKRTFAQSQKIWTMWVRKIDEWAHDALRTQLICDTLLIDGVEYFCPSDSYEPEWQENMNQNLAPVRIDLQKIQDVIFNKNL